jgi:hypothetical protein
MLPPQLDALRRQLDATAATRSAAQDALLAELLAIDASGLAFADGPVGSRSLGAGVYEHPPAAVHEESRAAAAICPACHQPLPPETLA